MTDVPNIWTDGRREDYPVGTSPGARADRPISTSSVPAKFDKDVSSSAVWLGLQLNSLVIWVGSCLVALVPTCLGCDIWGGISVHMVFLPSHWSVVILSVSRLSVGFWGIPMGSWGGAQGGNRCDVTPGHVLDEGSNAGNRVRLTRKTRPDDLSRHDPDPGNPTLRRWTRLRPPSSKGMGSEVGVPRNLFARLGRRGGVG